MNDCIFCKIINREIPSNIVYEDEKFLAFLDIAKATNGHTILIPKKHSKNILECDDNTLGEMIIVAKKIASNLLIKLNANGCNILTNCNEVAGQSCFHFHIHIIPRYNNLDGFEPVFKENKNKELSPTDILNKISIH